MEAYDLGRSHNYSHKLLESHGQVCEQGGADPVTTSWKAGHKALLALSPQETKALGHWMG